MPVPATCTACGTAIPRGASRCPGCGRVFGDENRCPSCQAHAGVVASSDGGFVCAACGAPRNLAPGTHVVPPSSIPFLSASPKTTYAKSVVVSGGSFGLRLLGAGVGGVGVLLGGLVILVAGTASGAIPAALVAMSGLGVGALLYRWGARASHHADRMSSSADELEILGLAEKMGGSLFATDAARALGIGVAEAEARLTAMADGVRVVAELTPEGLLRFDFREVRARAPGPAVRIAPPTDAEVVSAVEVEATKPHEGELRGPKS